MSVIDTPLSEATACQIAIEHFGLSVTAKALPSYEDQNFRLKDNQGNRYVLKIANDIKKRKELELQNQAMVHLAQEANFVNSPQVCLSKTGLDIVTLQDTQGDLLLVRLLTYLPGTLLTQVDTPSSTLLHHFGQFLGRMDHTFTRFFHPAMHRKVRWDLKHALDIKPLLENIRHETQRETITQTVEYYEAATLPKLYQLRTSVIHGDPNDYNVLVDDSQTQVQGIIDFGDLVHSYLIGELAIALTYVMMEKADPFQATCQVVAGYHEALPLTEPELEVLFPMICLRLCVSLTFSQMEMQKASADDYISVHIEPAWQLLQKLHQIHPTYALCRFRAACGMVPSPMQSSLEAWLTAHAEDFTSVVPFDLKVGKKVVFDFSRGTREDMGAAEWTQVLFAEMATQGAPVGIGQYNENRSVYKSTIFGPALVGSQDWRTLHIGIDLFVSPETPVIAPLAGKVHSFQNNATPLDYGPAIILEHQAGDLTFFTLYGHLTEDSLEGLTVGMLISQGTPFAKVGNYPTNGNWPPHLHFQIISDMLGKTGDFPGVAALSEKDIWLSLCPDPNLILGIPPESFVVSDIDKTTLLKQRQQVLSQALSIAYHEPLKIVRGAKQFLFDETGKGYLDMVNNVCHVGHCHPKVVQAAQKQIARLNTNTRYLHDTIVKYAQRLCALLPDPLNVCMLVCTGSEANDLALRIARTHTGQNDVIVLEGAYHGNTTSLIELSPYKFDGPGGTGKPEHVHVVMKPDTYRGPYKTSDSEAGRQYARHVKTAIDTIESQHRGVAAFFCESLLGCGGQIMLPPGYLKEAYRHMRSAGGLCVADEVQVGFGRVGSQFWGFQLQEVVPDIVTLGKPIGNGHPLAAVVTTQEIAESFNTGMEYFNTFGGNPVSCAIGMAVLDVIESESLQQNALEVGSYLMNGLQQLMEKHPLIGNIRGHGLFIGVELVLDRQTLEPASQQASEISEAMKEQGILVTVEGPFHNVLKIKPPLVFNKSNADFFLQQLGTLLV